MESRLSVKRPTSTTVLYTVSTRSPTKTLADHVATYLLILARVTVGFAIATVLLLEYRTSQYSIYSSGASVRLETAFLSSPFGQITWTFISSVSQSYRLVACAALAWLIFRKGYTEESLLVIRGLGVQTTTSSGSYLGTSSTRFIPTSNVQDVFIHEAFKGFDVKFYLSIVVEGEEDVVVVFPV